MQQSRQCLMSDGVVAGLKGLQHIVSRAAGRNEQGNSLDEVSRVDETDFEGLDADPRHDTNGDTSSSECPPQITLLLDLFRLVCLLFPLVLRRKVHDPPVHQYKLCLRHVVHAQPMQTGEEAEAAGCEDGASNGVGREWDVEGVRRRRSVY